MSIRDCLDWGLMWEVPAHCGQQHPSIQDSRLCKQADRAWVQEQARKQARRQLSFMVLAQTSSSHRLLPRNTDWTKYFPPWNYCWSEWFITATTKLEHRPGIDQLVFLPSRSFAPGQTAVTLSFRTLVLRLLLYPGLSKPTAITLFFRTLVLRLPLYPGLSTPTAVTLSFRTLILRPPLYPGLSKPVNWSKNQFHHLQRGTDNEDHDNAPCHLFILLTK